MPSRPAYGSPEARACSARAGWWMPVEGVKLAYGQPAAQGGGGVEGAGGEGAVGGGGLGGGDVDHDDAGEAVLLAEGGEVGGEGVDQFLGGAGVSGLRAAGADGAVGGLQFGADGGGQPVRQDAALGERLGALGQRAVGGVVAAEDQGGERGEARSGEGPGLGDEPGRRMEPGDRGGAARRRRWWRRSLWRRSARRRYGVRRAPARGRGRERERGVSGERLGGHRQPPVTSEQQ